MQDQTQTKSVEMFAIIELMGHQKIAGKLSEHVIGGSSFIRVDVPETDTRPGFTRLLTDKAIYAINPVTEEVARYSARQIEARPIEAWDLSRMITKQLEMSGKMIVDAPAGHVIEAEQEEEDEGGLEW